MHINKKRADVRFRNVILQNKERYSSSTLLMAVWTHSHSLLWEKEMIYLHFSSLWDNVKQWCWYPPGNADQIAFLPTLCLPAFSDVGSMYQNRVWHDVTFHLQALESQRYRLCPLPLLSLFLQAQSIEFFIWRNCPPLSVDPGRSIFFRVLQDQEGLE